jgi:hypothetical protein
MGGLAGVDLGVERVDAAGRNADRTWPVAGWGRGKRTVRKGAPGASAKAAVMVERVVMRSLSLGW